MTNKVSIAEVKNRFSEYISKVAYTHQQLIITKRNKPIAALIDLNTLKKAKSSGEKKGLASIIGKWRDSEELVKNIDRIVKTRSKDKFRHVPL